MKLITLAAICPDTLRPMSKREVYARAARRAAIAAEMARVAKASESALPSDERRSVLDVREGVAAMAECAIACAIAAPVACAIVFYQLSH
jgi:hypothetical protein